MRSYSDRNYRANYCRYTLCSQRVRTLPWNASACRENGRAFLRDMCTLCISYRCPRPWPAKVWDTCFLARPTAFESFRPDPQQPSACFPNPYCLQAGRRSAQAGPFIRFDFLAHIVKRAAGGRQAQFLPYAWHLSEAHMARTSGRNSSVETSKRPCVCKSAVLCKLN